ncbi:MAG: CNNM domain-containing protein [Verrucomicrobiota bacterium]
MGTSLWFYLLLILCLALSFLLSGMEAGVLAVSRFRVRRQMRIGKRRAQLLHAYMENPENFLWTILVGNTLAAFAAFTLVGTALFQAVEGHLLWFAPSLALFIFFFYALCDLLPKMLFRQFPNRLCLAVVVPFRLLHLGLSPLVAIVTWFSDLLLRLTGRQRFKGHIFGSRREVRLALQESAQILTSEERTMVNRVLDLQDLTVRSITVPAHRVVGVTAETPVRDLLEICRRQPVSRLPIWDRQHPTRRTVGVVNLSTFLYAETLDLNAPVRQFSKAPLRLSENTRLEEALRRMQRSRQRMAVVIGFDESELGIVNLRDILKSIFGEVTL